MKLNRVWLAAAATTVLAGSLAVAGCAMSGDDADDAPTEQANVSGSHGDQGADTASGVPGVTNYAFHGGGFHGGGRGGFGHGREGWGHAGWGHGRGWGHEGRWGWWGRDRRAHGWWW
jgi:hypothetical protein